jgi:hypothetical protein
VRGVPVESGRVKSSASVPTCEFWALFKSVVETNRLEGSAGNLRFGTSISSILCFCRLRLNEFADSISFTESNLTKTNPGQEISQRLLRLNEIRRNHDYGNVEIAPLRNDVSIYIVYSELRIILRIAFHISSNLTYPVSTVGVTLQRFENELACRLWRSAWRDTPGLKPCAFGGLGVRLSLLDFYSCSFLPRLFAGDISNALAVTVSCSVAYLISTP